MKILKISAGMPSDGSGVDADQMAQLLKLINDLGDELRSDADRKYVALPTFEDHVRKNEDEHRDMAQDMNHACIRIKLLEDFKALQNEHDARQDETLAQAVKATRKHEKQLEDIIYQLSQLSSRPTASGLSNPVSMPTDSGDMLDKMHRALDERLKGLGSSADVEALTKLQEQVNSIEAK